MKPLGRGGSSIVYQVELKMNITVPLEYFFIKFSIIGIEPRND
jgi:hypothetical protein